MNPLILRIISLMEFIGAFVLLIYLEDAGREPVCLRLMLDYIMLMKIRRAFRESNSMHKIPL